MLLKAIQVSIRRIGNSQGVLIPKPILTQLGLIREAEMTVEGGALVLRRPASPARSGWAEAAKKIGEDGNDALVMGEFGNEADKDLVWSGVSRSGSIPRSEARSKRRVRA